ncbi:MAG: hypothetical protein ACK6DZ_01610 [Acidobacteriota bacterium]
MDLVGRPKQIQIDVEITLQATEAGNAKVAVNLFEGTRDGGMIRFEGAVERGLIRGDQIPEPGLAIKARNEFFETIQFLNVGRQFIGSKAVPELRPISCIDFFKTKSE